MKKALCVGIDYYKEGSNLCGCVNDACSVKDALERNGDGTLNFGINLSTATSESSMLTKKDLKWQVEELFSGIYEVALFYFAGHGYIEKTGGYLINSECQDGDDGFPLHDLLTVASSSKSTNKIIILDSCYSGAAGNISSFDEFAFINEGMSILTACSKTQYANENAGHGVFTTLLVDALYGGAMNLLGEVTPGSVYAHIDQALGPWEQRPLFKTNVHNFVCLRKNIPPIELSALHKIVELFPDCGNEFQLTPTFEYTEENAIEEDCNAFKILQKYNHVNLVVPVGEEHMYYAAINSKSCRLTPLGVHYWNLVKKGTI